MDFSQVELAYYGRTFIDTYVRATGKNNFMRGAIDAQLEWLIKLGATKVAIQEIVSIHPYDLAEQLQHMAANSSVPVEVLHYSNGVVGVKDKLYQQDSKVPRTPGPHFIF